ncbi:MAG: CvpA family protein [Rhodobacteraceae bacterium]|nr:CvpA family protein [Paracoccaceae bacterium]
MSNLNYFDIAVIVIILMSSGLAYFRGVVREAMAILGWVIAGIGAYFSAPGVYPILDNIPLLSNIVQSSCELGVLISFVISLVILLLIMSFVTAVLSRIAKLPVINNFDQVIGLLFGAARGGIIVTIVVIAIETLFPNGPILDEVTSSSSSQLFAGVKDMIVGLTPQSTPRWLLESYQNLMVTCQAEI